jgi:hypothetical protein
MNENDINHFKEKGYVVIENVFNENEVNDIRNELHKTLSKYDINHDDIINGIIPPPNNIRNKSVVANIYYSYWKLKTMLDDRVYQICKSLMNNTFSSDLKSI